MIIKSDNIKANANQFWKSVSSGAPKRSKTNESISNPNKNSCMSLIPISISIIPLKALDGKVKMPSVEFSNLHTHSPSGSADAEVTPMVGDWSPHTDPKDTGCNHQQVELRSTHTPKKDPDSVSVAVVPNRGRNDRQDSHDAREETVK